MSHEQFRTAHVRVLCLEAGSGEYGDSGVRSTAVGSDRADRWLESDCRAYEVRPGGTSRKHTRSRSLETSAVTGLGIRELKEAIRAAVLQAAGPQTDVVVGTAVRCGESLRLAAASLDRAREAVRAGLGEELIATEVRVALSELGKVAGAVYSDDLLDRIFSRFCIGK